jgi:hypothetical protein
MAISRLLRNTKSIPQIAVEKEQTVTLTADELKHIHGGSYGYDCHDGYRRDDYDRCRYDRNRFNFGFFRYS